MRFPEAVCIPLAEARLPPPRPLTAFSHGDRGACPGPAPATEPPEEGLLSEHSPPAPRSRAPWVGSPREEGPGLRPERDALLGCT